MAEEKGIMFSYEVFKRIYDNTPGEPEFTIYFCNCHEEYMIIKYDDGPTFVRCSSNAATGSEQKFRSLDELYEADLVDGIYLRRDWNQIDYISYGHGTGALQEDDVDGYGYCQWRLMEEQEKFPEKADGLTAESFLEEMKEKWGNRQ